MRFLANENVPLPSVRALRRAGHDVISISERSPGIPDDEVVRIARAEDRLIVTFDRDYGELVFRRGLPVPAGILYLRFFPSVPEDVAAYVLRPIETGIAIEGRFTTADRRGVRQVILRGVGEIDSD